MAEKSGLSKENDFTKIYQGDDLMTALTQIKSGTDKSFSTVVLFCTGKLNYAAYSIPCDTFDNSYIYWLLYNQSLIR